MNDRSDTQALITALIAGVQAAHAARGADKTVASFDRMADAFLNEFVAQSAGLSAGLAGLNKTASDTALTKLDATERAWLQHHGLRFVAIPEGYLLCSITSDGPAYLGKDPSEMLRSYRRMLGLPLPELTEAEFKTSIAGLAPDHVANILIHDNLPTLLTLKRLVSMKNFRATKNTAAMAHPLWLKFNDLAKLRDDPNYGLIRDYVVDEIRPLCFAALGKPI